MKKVLLLVILSLPFFLFSQNKSNLDIGFIFNEKPKKDTNEFILKIEIKTRSNDSIFLPIDLNENVPFLDNKFCSLYSITFKKKQKGKYTSHTLSNPNWNIPALGDSSQCIQLMQLTYIQNKFTQEFDILKMYDGFMAKGRYKFLVTARVNGKYFKSKWFKLILKESIYNSEAQRLINR
jgi:hypothetical protein